MRVVVKIGFTCGDKLPLVRLSFLPALFFTTILKLSLLAVTPQFSCLLLVRKSICYRNSLRSIYLNQKSTFIFVLSGFFIPLWNQLKVA
jgi:hypothetical protein